jgi:hypothetical protein
LTRSCGEILQRVWRYVQHAHRETIWDAFVQAYFIYCSVNASRKLRTRASRSGLVKSFNPGLL